MSKYSLKKSDTIISPNQEQKFVLRWRAFDLYIS